MTHPESTNYPILQVVKHEATAHIQTDFSKPVTVVVHTCNPSTPEAEARGPQIQGHFGLHSKTLSQTNKQTKQNKK
jgi:hypothetical protein